MEPTIQIARSLEEVDRRAWDALIHGPSLFWRWGFLAAVERSGSIGPGTGWEPYYLRAEIASSADGAKRTVGACVAFVKQHSYGEYIFDWGWARASQRAGIPYYPKLVLAAPMTPATGPRLLLAQGLEADLRKRVVDALLVAIREIADEHRCSSIHWLFTTEDENRELAARGFMPRTSFQFHWRNRGYRDFADFLATLSSRKRKQIRKERERALAAIDGLHFVAGRDLTEVDVTALDGFYRTTVARHGGVAYLRPGFFEHLCQLLPDEVLLARAIRNGRLIGGALYLQSEAALYGRYWGCREEVAFLHFEAAYYAGIERCITHGIALFEAGAQGEHKLLRGFSPALTYSSHWIRHPSLRRAVADFLDEEARSIGSYMAELEQFSPYK